MPGPIKPINLIAPEIAPGGVLDTARWRRLQDFVNQATDAINTMLTTWPPWPGQAKIILAVGEFNVAPDENFIVVNLASTTPPPALPALADLSFVLPRRSMASGPIHIYTGDDTYARVTPASGDRLVFPDLDGGTGPSVDVFVDIGHNVDKVMSSFTPLKDSTTDWVYGEVTVRK